MKAAELKKGTSLNGCLIYRCMQNSLKEVLLKDSIDGICRDRCGICQDL